MKHPTAHRVAISNSELVIRVDHGDTLLGGILRAGVGVPYECNAGGCGSCKYTLLDGSVADDLEETAGLRARLIGEKTNTWPASVDPSLTAQLS